MPPDRPLLYQIERYMREHAISAASFGRLAARDPRLVFDLRRGRNPGHRLRSSIEHFMNKTKEPKL